MIPIATKANEKTANICIIGSIAKYHFYDANVASGILM